MTNDNTTETGEAQGEAGEDSAVIKALRKQIKDLESDLKSRPDRDSLAEEIRTELERDTSITAELGRLGHPAGILDTVKGKLGDAEVTRESVATALQGIGYQVEVDDAASEPESEQPSEQESDLARVSNLSASVRSAAQGGDSNDFMQKISQAETPAELQAVMEELGATASHT